MTGPASTLTLLEGSRAFFPALIEAFDAAREHILLETYIFNFHAGGAAVGQALVRAAQRGVRVQLVVDGVGTGPLPTQWQQRFADAGVQYQVFSAPGSFWLVQPSRWRRLHRKLCAVDGRVGFCGGINLLDDFYDPHLGVLHNPRFDLAVRLEGPLVASMALEMEQLWRRMLAAQKIRQREFRAAYRAVRGPRTALALTLNATNSIAHKQEKTPATLVFRDNFRHRRQIEMAYRKAIGEARDSVLIANAYFLPGGKLRRALVHAARRGVRVQLLLHNRYESFMQFHATHPPLQALLRAGIEIYEYAPGFLHAKAAVIDAQGHKPWATVGSSNLDPLSLLLAREANVVAHDPAFAHTLHQRLAQAIDTQGTRLDPARFARRPALQRLLDWMAYGLMRLVLWLTGRQY